jgi:glyoxylase-like metal-dependent hydrolase (beta-lactamase superfamily II)
MRVTFELMGKVNEIAQGIYLIGGPELSCPEDAASFVIDFDGALVMIDSGAGESAHILKQHIEDAGLNPRDISTLILTHNHIDHIGAAAYFRSNFGCKILIHERDADAVETGDSIRTAASYYGTLLSPIPVDRKLQGDEEILAFGNEELHCLHTPGHTPGSISIYLDREGKRILFGQDIHGPFMDLFGSDMNAWKKSMATLLSLEADILCEGHFGIFQPKESVRQYITGYLNRYS